jgi:glutathione S-transferase
MGLQLYDLAGADPERRFSPYCWRTKLALAHKGLVAETIPWRFTDKGVIVFSGQGRVPVLLDGNHCISDSWAIAVYLDGAYPDRPPLFEGPSAMAATRFINAWADSLAPMIAPLIATDVLAHLHEKDRSYFRDSRERRFGMTLEAASSNRESKVGEFRLPVLAIKLFGLVQHAQSAPRETRLQGIAYAAGVMISFAVVALALIGLRAAGAGSVCRWP